VGSGRRPWLVPVVAVLAAVVTVGAVFGVARFTGDDGRKPAAPPATPMSTVSSAPARTGTPAAGQSRLVSAGPPCQLVPRSVRLPLIPPPMDFRRAGLSGEPGQDGHSAGCVWRTARQQAPQQRALAVRVVLYMDGAGQPGQARVTAELEATRRTVRQRANTSVNGAGGSVQQYGAYRAVPGVGEDAFAVYVDERSATDRTGSVALWARYRNALLKVTFEGSDNGTTPLNETTALQGATTAARALVETLGSCTDCTR
jgi:hypothetical protein